MSDEKPIRAHAIVDVDTMVRAFKVHGGVRSLIVRFVMGVAGVFFILGAIRGLYNEQMGFAFVLGFLGIFNVTWAALSGYKLKSSIAKQLKQAGEERQEINYEISGTHLRLESKDNVTNLAWSKFRKWKENGGLILAYRHDQNFIVIPIDQFEPQAQEALRKQLTAHVPYA